MVKKILSKLYIVFILLFLYVPMIVLIVLSFNNSRSRVTWGGFTFDWYKKLFSNTLLMEALKNTLLLALLAAIIATIIGLFASLGICAMKRKNYQIVMSLTNIPLLNADIVTGIALMLWFTRFLSLGFTSLLLAHITFCIPYVILSVMPKVESMNVSIYEASRDLGANAFYAFFKAILPQLLGGIISGFFMAFTMSMDDFVITYFTKGAGINTFSTMIYGEIKKGIKPEIYALSTIIFAIVFIVLLIYNFCQKRRTLDEK